MRTAIYLLLGAGCLLVAGCDDSQNPLSDPETAKPDMRLAGVWRLRDKDGRTTYYHVGPAGGKLPGGVMRVVQVAHDKAGTLSGPGQFLVFPTSIGDGTYLSMTPGDEHLMKVRKEKGWKGVHGYFLLKYKVDGDKLLVGTIERVAKQKAIESGKIKGVVEKHESGPDTIRFTDTTENVARLVAQMGDSLFAKEPLRLERVR